MNWNAKWINTSENLKDVCPIYFYNFSCKKPIIHAELSITAMGVYEAVLNGKRVGDFVLAPGWTAFDKRLQVQTYDITDLLQEENQIEVTVGKGWYRSPMPRGIKPERLEYLNSLPAGLTAEIKITYEDGETEHIYTDKSWKAAESKVRFAEIYDGEVYDASFESDQPYAVEVFEGPTHTLIPQQGEPVREQERVAAAGIFVTPKGEIVVDFGQVVTGCVEINIEASKGDRVRLSHGEVLDAEGNFYNENYRDAKCQYVYTCRDGKQSYKPKFTYCGFRYIRIEEFPGGAENAKPENFQAVAVYSQMERTGYIRCSDSLLNKLFDNIIWGQKGNFVDVPTDCPQRDERMGWTGDVQIFARAAALNYDVEKFFTKWLGDLAADQKEDGMVGKVVPDAKHHQGTSAGWGDVAVLCPWILYQAYGNKEILSKQYESMKGWIDYIGSHTGTPYLWTGGEHYGDWLALDAPAGSFKGTSREDFIASAFYAHSTELFIKAGRILGRNVTEYEVLYDNIAETFRKTFTEYKTQTECVLAAYFKLAPNPQEAADQLADLIKACGRRLETGFIGTPYVLHVLSDYGYSKLAYELLLRREYPSWLYQVTKGATTVWEHWDNIMEDGSFWSKWMNSFNHYAFGSVIDWVYCKAAGINTVEEYPGYEKIRIAPVPDKRLDWLEAELKTRHGVIRSYWQKQGDMWKYRIETPVEAEIVINESVHHVNAGSYVFLSYMEGKKHDEEA